VLRRVARRGGYDLVLADEYSPVADVDRIPPTVWTQPAPMAGIAWDLDAQLAFLEEELGAWLRELDAPTLAPGNEDGYYLRNPFFPALDAEVLYALVRGQRPARVLELGSGFSTLVIARAARANRAAGSALEHGVFDPTPAAVVNPARDRIDLQRVSATEIPSERFRELAGGDILFIDTTHTLKPGGEVPHLLLDVLPTLAPGVLVHFHDFFRPFEYPRVLLEDFGVYWQEHYALQAFLAFNDRFEILCANHALVRLRGDRVRELVPSLEPDMYPCSLWLRKR